jgi:hypothetical protein
MKKSLEIEELFEITNMQKKPIFFHHIRNKIGFFRIVTNLN